jgi:hemolysin III
MNKFREPVSGLTHLIAAAAAVIGTAFLIYLGRSSLTKEISLIIYGVSLVLMFSASATYHLTNSSPGLLQFLRKMDHSAIYFLIAGSYTPICLYFFEGFWRWGLLSIIWLMALAGIIVKLFVIKAPRWITAGIYLLMGWLSILAINQMLAGMPAGALILLVAGGLFFTIGAAVYITKRPDFVPGVFGFHEIWHIFVILGCLSHYLMIVTYIAP